MKVPYTYPPFEVISSHHCTVLGVGGCSGSGGGTKIHSFASVHLSVMCIEQELKNLIWGSWEERVNEKFSNLLFRDFGDRTKFGQKIKFVCCV